MSTLTAEAPFCSMRYSGTPCGDRATHVVQVTCTNPACDTNEDVPLCTVCLQLVQRRGRNKCSKCGTGWTLTSPPRRIDGTEEEKSP